MRNRLVRIAVGFSVVLAGVTACGDVDESNDTAAATSNRRVIVVYKNTAGRGAALAAGQLEADLAARSAVAVTVPAATVAGLVNHPDVELVEDDARRYPLAQTMPYGIPMVQANLLSDADANARTICIIDSGYYGAHADLDHSSNVTGSEDSGTGSWSTDGCGHGTHVAGTIAALDNADGVLGVLPSGSVKLHIVKVFGDDCAWTYSSSLVAALDKCTAAGANVVSMSLGGSMKSRFEDSAFKSAYAAGVLSIAAAGNDGNSRMSYPAGYASVVSVGAIDSNKVVASFSQYNSDVELAAPGVGVQSSVPWYAMSSLSANGGEPWTGQSVEGSATGAASGALVDGGKCASVGAWTGMVVLCQRGDITFADKVNNVVAGGGVAAVIYNNVTSDSSCGDFGATLGEGASSTIPGITLSCDAGAAAVAAAEQGATADVVNTLDKPASGYEAWNGTSMATPHVSGVAALVWSHHQGCSNAQIRTALQASAEDLGATGRDAYYGFGLVQAQAAADYLTANPCDGGGDTGGGGGGDGGTCSAGASCDADPGVCGACGLKCGGKPGKRTCR